MGCFRDAFPKNVAHSTWISLQKFYKMHKDMFDSSSTLNFKLFLQAFSPIVAVLLMHMTEEVKL